MTKIICYYIFGSKVHTNCQTMKVVGSKKSDKHQMSFMDVPNSEHTGKSLSEALIFASTNPQYDDRLFNTWKFQAQTWGENVV